MKAIGIDLGTTNSVAAYYDGKTVTLLGGGQSDNLVPSVVMYRKELGKFDVGAPAIRAAYLDPENTVFSIKRLMGLAFAEEGVAKVRDRVSYRIVSAAGSEDPGVRVQLGDKEYLPEEISAMILKQIREQAERALGDTVTHAVITVPAYFDERQRAATRRAGEKAGLIIKKIIDEPSAAAVAYGYSLAENKRQTILVFDLGGGTFDVSLIATAMDPKGFNHFEVLDIRGDNFLGGDDFDRTIVADIVADVQQKYDFNPSEDRAFLLLAKQAAEEAKKLLLETDQSEILRGAICKAPDGTPVNLQLILTRERFDTLIKPYLDKCMDLVEELLVSQGYAADMIDTVLMVGGSTLAPPVYGAVTAFFGKDKVRRSEPYHAVAKGAGILAGTLEGVQCPACKTINDEAENFCKTCGESLTNAASVGSTSLGEVTAKAIGVRAVRGNELDVFQYIIPKGTAYPTRRPETESFLTSADNLIRIPVYQGNESIASRNEEQGVIEIGPDVFAAEGIEIPSNTPVQVGMGLTRDGVISIQVSVQGKPFRREFTLRRDRPRQAAAPLSEDAPRLKEDLKSLVDTAEDLLLRYVSFMDSAQDRRLKEDIAAARQALQGDDPKMLTDAFNRLSVTLNACGIASSLFLSEKVQAGMTPDRAEKMKQLIQDIKTSWFAGDRTKVETLLMTLRAAIAAEISVRRERKEVPGQLDFGGLLRIAERK